MKVLLGRQKEIPEACCDRWKERPFNWNETDRASFVEDFYSRELPSEGVEPYISKLFRYRLFPSEVMSFRICKPAAEPRLSEGSLIIQRIHLGFMTIESAVRVTRVFDEQVSGERHIGFRYSTLQGHPEKGFSDFFLRISKDGKIFLNIHSFSSPSNLLGKILRPWGRRMQKKSTQKALIHFGAEK